ncbi:DUF2927 domain-containing protein [Aestuariibius insulae]|uniref:DUF2927 domain-containing protein n=1 Tax=Aestuariibius insulae TaxID=2058287 RepID=UPI00345E775D
MATRQALRSDPLLAARASFALAMIAGLAACDFTEPVPPPAPEPPKAAPAAPPAPRQAPAPKLDRDAQIYFKRLQDGLLVQGLLRQDGGGPDTPYTARELARNFIQIALYDEYRTEADTLVPEATESVLRRWSQPVRIGIEYGAAVPPAQRAEDSAFIARFAIRLSRLTKHPVSVAPAAANFHVLILDETSRQAIAPRLRNLAPGISETVVREIVTLPRTTLCLVVAFPNGPDRATYSKAIAVVRAEHPELIRKGCIQEELAQGMGLANDSPQARPSIFNDDEEFARLTTHDEQLLKMLYDPRMRPGMTVNEAEPVARVIARELAGEGES